MKIYKQIHADERPKEIESNPYKVLLAKNISEIIEEDVVSYVFDYYEYTPDEYIATLQQENTELKQELLDTQMALCDLYEEIEG